MSALWGIILAEVKTTTRSLQAQGRGKERESESEREREEGGERLGTRTREDGEDEGRAGGTMPKDEKD